jgi:hypothetical protein
MSPFIRESSVLFRSSTALLFETRERFIRSANTCGDVLIDVSDVRHDRCTRHFHSYRNFLDASECRKENTRISRCRKP